MMDDDYYEDDPDTADYYACIEIINEALRTGQTDGIVAMLGRPLSPIEREMLAQFLATCQLIKKGRGVRKKMRDEAEMMPVVRAIEKHLKGGALLKVAFGKVSDELGEKTSGRVRHLWYGRPKKSTF